MTRYRKKPVVIEAIRYQPGAGCNCAEVARFMGLDPDDSAACVDGADCTGLPWSIDTLEGSMRADQGDWIIRGVAGEFYPCKPDIFDATYEPADLQEHR